MLRPDWSLEESCGDRLVAGVDEAGRGPLAGPVVAAAVIFNTRDLPEGVADSKTLAAPQREALYLRIRSCAVVATGTASVEEIDALNILHASMLAMRRAVEALATRPGFLLIDGNRLPRPLPCPARAIVAGDARSFSIAAASIVAKVTRDRLMAELARAHPAYGWEKNAGYATKAHREAIAAHGVTPHHRRSFSPVREALGPDAQERLFA